MRTRAPFSAFVESSSAREAGRSLCKTRRELGRALAPAVNDVLGWYEPAGSGPRKPLHLRMCFSAARTERRRQHVLRRHSSLGADTVQECKEQPHVKGLLFSLSDKEKIDVKYLDVWGKGKH